MKKKHNIFMILGAVLVFSSLMAMMLSNVLAIKTYEEAVQTAKKIQQMLPSSKAGMEFIYSSNEMPVLAIDSADYIALLKSDKANVCLPVQSNWSKQSVSDTPCRFYGSCYDGSIVIGANSKQFAFLSTLDLEDKITVTDMLGSQFNYRVEKIERSKSASSDKIINNDYQLTLFMREQQTNNYIIVRCKSSI